MRPSSPTTCDDRFSSSASLAFGSIRSLSVSAIFPSIPDKELGNRAEKEPFLKARRTASSSFLSSSLLASARLDFDEVREERAHSLLRRAPITQRSSMRGPCPLPTAPRRTGRRCGPLHQLYRGEATEEGMLTKRSDTRYTTGRTGRAHSVVGTRP